MDIADVAARHEGATADAAVFGSPTTVERLAGIELSGDQTVVLGLVWNEVVQGWGIRNAWLADGNGDVASVDDCGVFLTEQLRYFRDQRFADADLKTVLLDAPFETADELFYGPAQEDEPFDITALGRLNGGDSSSRSRGGTSIATRVVSRCESQCQHPGR